MGNLRSHHVQSPSALKSTTAPTDMRPHTGSGSTTNSGALETQVQTTVTSYVEAITERTIRLVLYGAGEVGKTTFMKKMMLLRNANVYNMKKQARPHLLYNVYEGAKITILAARRLFQYEFEPEEKIHVDIVLEAFKAVQNLVNACNLEDEEFRKSLLYLLGEGTTFRKTLSRRNEYALFDTWVWLAERFINEYPQWGGPDWVPDDEDILRCRVRSTGLQVFDFGLNDQKYQLTDLGGQRVERQKNFLYHINTDCLLFVASLSEYDEVLFEDPKQNRLRESIALWKSVLKHELFTEIPIILCLNKLDLFKKKYIDEKVRIVPAFKYRITPPKVEDEEPGSCAKAIEWFKDLYRNQVSEKRKGRVYITAISAFDNESVTQAMENSLDFIKDKLVLRPNLGQGMM